MKKSILNYLDIEYIVKFILLFLVFYFFHIFFLGLTSPGGDLYSSFLESKLNYISWFTDSILLTASLICKVFGLHSYLAGQQIIRADSGVGVQVWLPCLGLGISSFWVAFVMAHKDNWKGRLLWSLVGVFTIWFINCWRIAILLLALERNWQGAKYIDHHDMFNFIAYSFILVLIYFYGKKDERFYYNKLTL